MTRVAVPKHHGNTKLNTQVTNNRAAKYPKQKLIEKVMSEKKCRARISKN